MCLDTYPIHVGISASCNYADGSWKQQLHMHQLVQVSSFPCLGCNVMTLAYYLITRKGLSNVPKCELALD